MQRDNSRTVVAAGMVLVVLAAAMSVAISARAAAADLSTPKSAAAAFAKALEAGDVDAAKAAGMTDAQNVQLIEALADMGGNVSKLRDAVNKKFGEGSADQLTGGRKPLDMSKQLDDAQVKEDGDTATLTDPKQPTNSMTLKKVGNDWHVDLASNPQAGQMIQQIPFLKALSSSFGEVATEVAADKYKTVDEAKQAMQAKIMGAMASMRRPTPATAPSATAPAAPAAPAPAPAPGE